jgi:Cu(I)/Ag(I) efflux system membrane fusion protein
MSERGRSILPGVALAAAGLVLGIVFHEPLAAWFAPLFAGEPGVESVGGETTARPPEAAVMGHEAHQGHASPGHSDDGAISHYTCPMHPSVRQPGPGSCPLCGMDLTPVMVRDLASGTIVLDAERRQLIGVTTEAASRRVLRREVRAFGRVVEDETRLADVNLRMSGWIGDLRANQTGATVTKGETLFTLYSPELYAAQLEHLSVVSRIGESGSATFAELARASRRRLALLGLDESQIVALERRGKAWEQMPILAPASGVVLEKNIVEGSRVEAGAKVLRIADLTTVWIDADVFEADLSVVEKGAPVTVTLSSQTGQSRRGQVDFIYPEIDPATRTARLRVVVDNADLSLKPDMVADLAIAITSEEVTAIPEAAVLYTGPRRLVFVDEGEGRLRPVEVRLGRHGDGYVEVLDGVEAGQVVVTSGNFLVAAESRIRAAGKAWGGGHEHH